MADPSNDMSGLDRSLDQASESLRAFAQGPAQRAAEDVGRAFERAGARIGSALGGAALSGELSFKRMSKVVLEELAKIALKSVFGGETKMNMFGARAVGGPVTPGGAYLVGERGPELFTPRRAGSIAPLTGGAVNVHFHFGAGADSQSVVRHQGQIAAQVARAVAYGRRNL